MRLKGKIALVTGGSRGMGRAISLALAREGAQVAVNYWSESDQPFRSGGHAAAEEVRDEITAAGGECLLLPADIADDAAARQVVRETVRGYGGLDILVCNAGICPMHEFLDLPIELFDRVHAVNLRGHFSCSQEAARVMIDQGRGGRIIAISSVAARIGGGQQSHYCPTKSGLHSLIQCMAISLGPHGITCNSIGPGEIDTEMNHVIPGYQSYWQYLNQTLPLRRIGQPGDVADPVVFLASDDARYITGQLLMVDGGWLSTPLTPAEGPTTT
jgi:L-rhamnose 1-dehydrogenase